MNVIHRSYLHCVIDSKCTILSIWKKKGRTIIQQLSLNTLNSNFPLLQISFKLCIFLSICKSQ